MAASLLAFATPAFALGISAGGNGNAGGTATVRGHQISTNGSVQADANANVQVERHSNSWFWNNHDEDNDDDDSSSSTSSQNSQGSSVTSSSSVSTTSNSRSSKHSSSGSIHNDNGLHGTLTLNMWNNTKERLYTALNRGMKLFSKAAHRYCGDDASTAACLANAKAELKLKFESMLTVAFGD